MNQFEFNGVELPNVIGIADPIPVRLGSYNTPMRIGGKTSSQFADVRKVNIQGVYVNTPGTSFSEMELSFATFCTNMYNAGEARLSLRKNWFYLARVAQINTKKDNVGSIEYDIDFVLSDPRQYKIGPDADGGTDAESTLAVTWDTNFTVPAGLPTPMKLYLVVTAGYPTTLQLAPNYAGVVGDSLTWTIGATGTTIVDFESQSASRGGVDVTAEFSGDFFQFIPGGTMKITPTPGIGTHTTPTLHYREARF